MLEYIITKLAFVALLSGTFFAFPVDAWAAIPAVAEVAVEYLTELSLLAAGVCLLVALDTMSWPILTKKK